MNRSRTLERALTANAIFSLTSGTIFTLFASPLAAAIGLTDGLVLRIVGVGLLPFGAWVLALSRSDAPSPKLGKLVSFLDAQWVVGTAILLVAWPDLFNALGLALAIGIALCVATFATWQIYGVLRIGAGAR